MLWFYLAALWLVIAALIGCCWSAWFQHIGPDYEFEEIERRTDAALLRARRHGAV